MNNAIAELENLTKIITESIKKAQNEEIYFEELYSNSFDIIGKNEFLFFLKPEITLASNHIKIEKILELIHAKIEKFGLKVHNIKILSAKYLEDYDIMSQHYAVINKGASDAAKNMSDSGKEAFKKVYSKPIDEVKVLGGKEFLNQYSNFNAYSLDYLWQNVKNEKLSGGTYCEVTKVDDEIIYLVNGFFPRALKHYTEKGRSIVVMTLSGNISWKDARNNFIGSTKPFEANPGSLRREFFDNKDSLGLAEISQGINGVHLSAGPVEALGELKRFNSDFSKANGIKDFTDFSFGKVLKESFGNKLDEIVEDPKIDIDGKQISVFDLTEEKDSDVAISTLKQYF